ncbi:conserved hypothetical protein [Talaromyces stipitatus ATCC 10500]|uniref:2-haloalkanoic acid dehalogenase n=1 Tax=Talaromyces stipitatus (strain ATCC 10500 / CBS 375.48 / QM 6759 / NRRL 1006) TaxID=441959 RepID=B8LVH3_TALSN|nr:uncharacterized protein TSTA_073780 [Talaromyces stipitatus ATCC 10500]EED23992.1 conserved hypothetical protein [Talaromyces stipitatus ATCC 10500]
MAAKKHVVFDVVGTCVSFDAYSGRIDSVIGERLRSHCINTKHFGFSWQTAAELEYTFLSVAESYRPYKEVLKATFYRTLWMAGIEDPRSFASDAERDQCIEGYSLLRLRQGTQECFDTLKRAGFTVWCLTTGDTQRVRGYFERAGVHLPLENFISCDAAHMWDASAAAKAGFRAAYCTVYEKEPCFEIFDTKVEVIADSLPAVAEKIVATYS